MKVNYIVIFARVLPLAFFIAFISGCASEPKREPREVTVEYYDNKGNLVKEKKIQSDVPEVTGNFSLINEGDGNYLNIKSFRKRAEAINTKSGISLNFENASINEVVSMIIGKILHDNYLIDPAVKGVVNLQSTRNLNKESVFYVLENILDIHGAKIVRHSGHYRILPKNKPVMGMVGINNDDVSRRLGYGFRVVPLRFIATDEMVKILETVTNKSSIIKSDEKRNLLILGGSSNDISIMTDTVNLFDVDWMQGTSVALLKIKYSNVTDVISDLNKMLQSVGAKGTAGNIVTLEPIERLNSIMLISKNLEYIKKIESWVSKLDIPSGGEGKKLYVYSIKHTNAEELSSTLTDLFSGARPDVISESAEPLAPGAKPVVLTSTNEQGKQKTNTDEDIKNDQGADNASVRIIPANDSNSLLIMSTPGEYSKIEEALQLLDIPPLQVLIEVTIMDVRLTDELSYGMQWFFSESGGSYDSNITVGGDLSFDQTFSYSAVKQSGNVRRLLGALASDGRVDVLSSPSLLVRNNAKASIRVGDQQPITTALIGAEGNIVASSVQFKDTGVILEIKPTVNMSGTVNVNISQEVTDIGDIDDATGQRAFLRRSIKSAVSVADGETIILGGLIRSNKADVESGVPGLRDIPLLGGLFGKTITSEQRTELIVMLSPKIIRNSRENNKVAEEYKKKFSKLFNSENNN